MDVRTTLNIVLVAVAFFVTTSCTSLDDQHLEVGRGNGPSQYLGGQVSEPGRKNVQTEASPQVGMHLVFFDNFKNNDIDIEDRRAPGLKWYIPHFFGGQRDPQGQIQLGPHGVILQHAAISTATLGNFGRQVVGQSFTGPFYIEALISLGPEQPSSKIWPAFWSMAVEHLTGGPDARNPDGAGDRFIEDDFFERDTGFAGPKTYGATLHDWHGRYHLDCPKAAYCDTSNTGHGAPNSFVIPVNAQLDWRKPHRVGQLLSVASPSGPGSIQNYLDGKPIGRSTSWGSDKDTFGVIDRQHLVVFFQTGDQFMTVSSIGVWKP